MHPWRRDTQSAGLAKIKRHCRSADRSSRLNQAVNAVYKVLRYNMQSAGNGYAHLSRILTALTRSEPAHDIIQCK
jgi:hypothetical protein